MQLKILVVDDDPEQAFKMERILSELGHRLIARAPFGDEALRLRKELKPDVVLMDLDRCGSGGIGTAHRMNRFERLPVVIVTQKPDQELAARAVEAEIYAYLVKPLNAEILGPALELAYLTFQKETTLERQLVDLKKELADRKYISRAVGKFMDDYGITEKEAMAMLESQAQNKNLSQAQYAAEIVEG